MLLKNKIVLVIGATSGIGKKIAELAAKEGAMVIVSGRRKDKGLQVVDAITQNGGTAEFVQMNVMNLEHSYSVIDELVQRLGHLDVVFYNTGITTKSIDVDHVSEEEWDAVMHTNLRSGFFMIQHLLPVLEQSKGNVVFTTSPAATSCVSGEPVYAASKAGLNQMIRVMASVVAKRGIRINAVAPGPTKTEILEQVTPEILESLQQRTPMHVLLEPEDIANGAIFLASSKARYITGTVLTIDAGASLR